MNAQHILYSHTFIEDGRRKCWDGGGKGFASNYKYVIKDPSHIKKMFDINLF